jgi:hypothetical protein
MKLSFSGTMAYSPVTSVFHPLGELARRIEKNGERIHQLSSSTTG